ncbi:MAG: cyclic lactone autoinducer peptide [Anaeromicrobium sp.]|jgi:cyclic lactone autoinducer peptide|nr:cyclic lactone autoinducer peptide [Anaeromicrobium sp.]MCT4594394.1 cyclic lactone autoinducer peptide [Anaeromicrobium sp.]
MKYKIVSLYISLFAFVGTLDMNMFCKGWYYEPKPPEGLKELQ